MWFLCEPLLFDVYCTHKFEENLMLSIPFRTGQGRIEYNPLFLENLDSREIEKLLKIEIFRIILKHPYERVPTNPNLVALKTASDITVYENCLAHPSLKNAAYYNFDKDLSYEEYYNKLYYICPDVDANGNSWTLDSLSQNSQKGKGQASGDDDGEENNQSESSSSSDDSNEEEDSENAGGSSQVLYSEENGVNAAAGQGEKKDSEFAEAYIKSAEGAELWQNNQEMSDTINLQIQKAEQTNRWGSVSGDCKEFILASLQIPMDYRRILSQFRTSIISKDRHLTRMKPNRRSGFDYMGSKFEPKTKLLVAVDVSGSISSEDLQKFFSIVNRFFAHGVESIQVIAFDTEIKQEYLLKKAKRKVEVIGRGGTNFQCVIDYYEEHNEYDGLIIYTDGYAPTPKVHTNRRVLWVLTSFDTFRNAKEWILKYKRHRCTWIPTIH